jgi:hypothetical protein
MRLKKVAAMIRNRTETVICPASSNSRQNDFGSSERRISAMTSAPSAPGAGFGRVEKAAIQAAEHHQHQ